MNSNRWAIAISALSLCVAIAVATLALVRDRAWAAEVGYLKGQLATAPPERLHRELAAIKNWMIAVYERGSSHGWDLPQLPKEAANESEEAAVQPTGRGDGGVR